MFFKYLSFSECDCLFSARVEIQLTQIFTAGMDGWWRDIGGNFFKSKKNKFDISPHHDEPLSIQGTDELSETLSTVIVIARFYMPVAETSHHQFFGNSSTPYRTL